MRSNDEFIVVVYSRKAQQFVVDNLDTIAANDYRNSNNKADNQGFADTLLIDYVLIDIVD